MSSLCICAACTTVTVNAIKRTKLAIIRAINITCAFSHVVQQ